MIWTARPPTRTSPVAESAAGPSDVELRGEKICPLQRSAGGNVVSHLDIGERDALAMLAEGGVFIDDEGLDNIIWTLHSDFRFVDRLNCARGPGFAEVGARFFELGLVEDHHRYSAEGLGLLVFVSKSAYYIADMDIRSRDLLVLLAKAGIHAGFDLVARAILGFHREVAAGNGGDRALHAVRGNLRYSGGPAVPTGRRVILRERRNGAKRSEDQYRESGKQSHEISVPY